MSDTSGRLHDERHRREPPRLDMPAPVHIESDVFELRQALSNAHAWVEHERKNRREGRRLWLLLVTPAVIILSVILSFHATAAATGECVGSLGTSSACHVNVFTVIPWWLFSR